MRPDVMVSTSPCRTSPASGSYGASGQRGDTLPVIAVTGFDTPADKMRDAGFDVSFTKPVDHNRLIQTLHTLAAGSGSARDRRVVPFRPVARRDLRRHR